MLCNKISSTAIPPQGHREISNNNRSIVCGVVHIYMTQPLTVSYPVGVISDSLNQNLSLVVTVCVLFKTGAAASQYSSGVC